MAFTGNSAIRGSRIGGGADSFNETERGAPAPRQILRYFCDQGHENALSFATDAEIPEQWDCVRCGHPASQDRESAPEAPRTEPYKTHLAYVKERRSDEEGAALLEEALETLRNRRTPGL